MDMSTTIPNRDELALLYLDQLEFEPYAVQEEALFAWFRAEQGVLVCAPTGTGKTLIAEAALFEALHTRKVAYYTTPLIALTEQKFQEMQKAAVRWGFDADDVGLVTGNRRVNPDAKVLIVVAEILLNRLLHESAFDFTDVSAVVMDEFHSFNDPQRGIVWELALSLLPAHIRLLLLSATVGNAAAFVSWLNHCHHRKIELIQSADRRVPLSYHWIPDQLLSEQLQIMAEGDDRNMRTPALIFCFNREECWSVAEQLKGKHLIEPGQTKMLANEVNQHDWSQGVGPKLKKILLRGVGVHHAGLLPKYKRIVESLFQRRLLAATVCTETLSAGMNLPARSVVLVSLLKGPPEKKKLIDSTTAHQIFGRAGRPQFDDHGYVYALAHDDDVKILRWKERFDSIPANSKDPALLKAKKAMKKKMPTRRKNQQYWSEAQFEKLKIASPVELASRGPLPWRMLSYLLSISPEVERLRSAINKRLLEPKELKSAQRSLNRMLITLWAGDFVQLDPEPDLAQEPQSPADRHDENPSQSRPANKPVEPASKPVSGTLAILLQEAQAKLASHTGGTAGGSNTGHVSDAQSDGQERDEYKPVLATPTAKLDRLLVFRSVNPMYGVFLVDHLGSADLNERIQAFESVLDIAGSMLKHLRVPRLDEMPPGPLATEVLHPELLSRGLATEAELTGQKQDESDQGWERTWPLTLAEKLRLFFDSEYPNVGQLRTRPVWAVGELLRFGGDFNKLVTTRKLTKQEGIVFRHFLRFVLLMDEFSQICPPDYDEAVWRGELRDMTEPVTAACRQVDPDSTDKAIADAHAADVIEGEMN